MKPTVFFALLATVGAVCAQGPLVRSFPLTTTNGVPCGLEHNLGGDLLFTDIGTAAELGRCNVNGAIAWQVNVSATSGNPLGITIVTNPVIRVYVTDTTGPDVDVYDNFGAYISSFPVSAQTAFPEGITHRTLNDHLYVVDGAGGDKVSEYTTTGTWIADYPILGYSPDGIAWDALTDTFWIYDSGTDTCRNYNNVFVELRNFPGPISNGFSYGEGVAIIGTELFVCATGSSAVCVYDTLGVPSANIPYGAGCPEPATFYELFPGAPAFDLGNRAIRLSPIGTGGYTVVPSTMTLDPNFTSNLFAGDDQLFQALPLGFTIPTPAGMQSTVDVDSNGRCGWGLLNSDFTESIDEFVAQTMLAPLWDDLDPSTSGAVYFDQSATKTMVTWDQVTEYSGANANTVQVQFYATGDIVIVWGACALQDCLVGASFGGGFDPGSRDISATLPFATGGGVPMGLGADANPVLGTTANLTMSNVPGGTIAAGLLIGFAPNSVSLDPLGMTGCTDLTDFDVVFGTFPLPTATLPVSYPNLPALLGASVYWQGFAVTPGINPFGLVLSSGLQTLLGNV